MISCFFKPKKKTLPPPVLAMTFSEILMLEQLEVERKRECLREARRNGLPSYSSQMRKG